MSKARMISWTTADGGMHTYEEVDWNPQDTVNGRALRLLAEAIPKAPSWTVRFYVEPEQVSITLHDETWREFYGKGATIAEAADMCRQSLKEHE